MIFLAWIILFLLIFQFYEGSRKYYISMIIIALVGFYELIPLSVYKIGFQEHIELVSRVVPGLSPSIISRFSVYVILVIIVLYLGIVYEKKFIRLTLPHAQNMIIPKEYLAISSGLIILIFGMISLIQGGGEARIKQYAYEFNAIEISSFHFYATLMAPITVFYALKNFQVGNKCILWFSLAALGPAITDFFIAGRRQMFAPLFCLGVFFLLGSKKLTNKKKIIILSSFVIIALIIFSIQFSLRYRAMGMVRGFEVELFAYATNFLSPQLHEFIGAGSTSLAAFRDTVSNTQCFLLGPDKYTSDLIWGLPGLKKIFLIIGVQRPQIIFDFSNIAPFGALTLLAEALLYFGVYGSFAAFFIFGIIISIIERVFLFHFRSSFTNNSLLYDFYVIALSVAIFKYRSGSIDMFSAIVSVSILFALNCAVALMFRTLSPIRLIARVNN